MNSQEQQQPPPPVTPQEYYNYHSQTPSQSNPNLNPDEDTYPNYQQSYVSVDQQHHLVQNVQNLHHPEGTLPRSLSASDLSSLQALQMHQNQRPHPHQAHPSHHHHYPHHPQAPLSVDIAYHQHQQQQQQLYTPIQQQHPGHDHLVHSSSNPTSPPPLSPVGTGGFDVDALQSPLSSAPSSEHSHPLSHGHGHFAYPPHGHPHPHHHIGPGTVTPNTTPSSGAPSPGPSNSNSNSNSLSHNSHSPTSNHSRSSSLVQRSNSSASNRYNPHGISLTRRKTEEDPYGGYGSDGDDDMGLHSVGSFVPSHGPGMGMGIVPSIESMTHNRKEATRRQRIEAEQRRRDELREGYARLKDVLPITNQKSSKVSLLDRAVQHIVNLTKMNEALQASLTQQDVEIQRLRSLNERIALPSTLGVVQRAPSPIMSSLQHPGEIMEANGLELGLGHTHGHGHELDLPDDDPDHELSQHGHRHGHVVAKTEEVEVHVDPHAHPHVNGMAFGMGIGNGEGIMVDPVNIPVPVDDDDDDE